MTRVPSERSGVDQKNVLYTAALSCRVTRPDALHVSASSLLLYEDMPPEVLPDPEVPIWPAPPEGGCPECHLKALPFRVDVAAGGRVSVSVRCPVCKHQWTFERPAEP